MHPDEKRVRPEAAGEPQKISVRVYYEDAGTVIWR